MGQLERYGLYVLVLVIFLILGVAIWGGDPNSIHKETRNLPVVTNSDLHRGVVTLDDLALETTLRPSKELENIHDQIEQAAPRHGGRNIGGGQAPGTEKEIEPAPGPVVRYHTIRKDEILGNISMKYYGTSKRWMEIAAANPTINPKRLKPGTEIVIPDLDEQDRGRKQPPSSGSPVGRDYKVKRHDNPARISKKLFGNEEFFTMILEMNPRLDPLRMRPGDIIRVPTLSDIQSR